jgi:hypothetical protein
VTTSRTVRSAHIHRGLQVMKSSLCAAVSGAMDKPV